MCSSDLGERVCRLVLPGKGNIRQKTVGDLSGWHHYTVVWDDNVFKAYLDGKLLLTFDKPPKRGSDFGHAHLGEIGRASCRERV